VEHFGILDGQLLMNEAFRIAGQHLGLSEGAQAAAISDFISTGGANLDPVTRAWCADFVNASLSRAGMQGTGSGMARSFLDWGQPVDQPQQGDVAVFSRGDPNGPYGHVGFFDGYNPDGTIRVLGGNQGDAVSIANYSANDLLGFRRGETGQPAQNALAGAPQMDRMAQFNALASAMPKFELPQLNAFRIEQV
jgi:uncharacterized protein (TIGR02594 family)